METSVLVLVANLGSTSFKYRLFNMDTEQCLARGAVERIGDAESQCAVSIGDWTETKTMAVPDHGVAVSACLDQLTDADHGAIKDASEVAVIGFKAVHGGRLSGTFIVNDDLLDAMSEMNAAAPAHNPPYIAAMKLLRQRFPELPLVAAFETEFHRTIPDSRTTYAIPAAWTDGYQVRRWGFHGASHQYIAERTAKLLGHDDAKIISCHLGGSSSLTAIDSGKSVMTTMGMTPQTGLPQNNRVGDFDPFALPLIMQRTGDDLETTLKRLASEGGLLGISENSGDIRDLTDASEAGDGKSKLALDVYIEEIRRHMGGMMVALGGLDAIVFTGGIGENAKMIRSGVCDNLESFGIKLDASKNDLVDGEQTIHADESQTQIWVVPTNEEWIVAKRTVRALNTEH